MGENILKEEIYMKMLYNSFVNQVTFISISLKKILNSQWNSIIKEKNSMADYLATIDLFYNGFYAKFSSFQQRFKFTSSNIYWLTLTGFWTCQFEASRETNCEKIRKEKYSFVEQETSSGFRPQMQQKNYTKVFFRIIKNGHDY